MLNAIDRYEKEPWTILFATVALGAVAAPLLTLAVFLVSGRPVVLTPQLAPAPGGADPIVGVVQELAKGSMLLLLTSMIRDEFDDVLDGVVYGAALGAGYGAAETFVYAAGGTGSLSAATLGALLVSGLNHAFYGAVFGAALGFGGRQPAAGRRALVIVYGLASAALLHALHDTLPAILSRLLGQPDAAIGVIARLVATLVNVLGLVALAFIVWGAWRRETRVLHEHLRPEVEGGVVSADDYAAIGSLRARLGRQAEALRRRGLGEVRALRRLYATEGELAFVQWRRTVSHRRPPPPERAERLREEIRRLRGELEARGS